MRKKGIRGDFTVDSRLFFITVIALFIGGLSTVFAYILLNLIHLFTNIFFYQEFANNLRSPANNTLGLWVIIVPVLGGGIIGLIARFGSEQIRGHGIPEAIQAIQFGKSKISGKVAVLKPLSSGIAIGSGCPFGAEGPVIMTGGALGSLIGQFFHITGAERKTLLVAGATAGMTAIFNAPIAAVLLAVELLLFELRPRSLLPVIVACVVAGFFRPFLFETGPLFPLETPSVGPLDLLSCVLAGIACGIFSWSLSSFLCKVEEWFSKLPIHWMWWPALGGVAVGIGGYLQPRALGMGYEAIGDLLQSHLALHTVAALLLCKAVMWVIALGSSTSGGVFAPLLMMGAGLGAVLGPFMPGGHSNLWPLICMAATLGGMIRAPITAVLLAFELTHDINALLPLLATSVVAYGFTLLTMPRSILTDKSARRGYPIYCEYGIDPLERHNVEEVMAKNVQTLESNISIATALATYFGPNQKHRAYPVVRNNAYIGMVDRETLFAHHENPAYSCLADLFGANVPIMALPHETCRTVAGRLAVHGLERLPVVTDAQSRELLGIVSRSDLIKPSLNLFEEEQQHETLLSTPFSKKGQQE